MTQTKKEERFFARLLFKYQGVGDREGREIAYIYNREALDQFVDIEHQTWDNSQFIEIGNIITLEGRKCKIVEINFKLDDHINEMEHGYGINLLSPTDPTNFNCQIGVFVEPLD